MPSRLAGLFCRYRNRNARNSKPRDSYKQTVTFHGIRFAKLCLRCLPHLLREDCWEALSGHSTLRKRFRFAPNFVPINSFFLAGFDRSMGPFTRIKFSRAKIAGASSLACASQQRRSPRVNVTAIRSPAARVVLLLPPAQPRGRNELIWKGATADVIVWAMTSSVCFYNQHSGASSGPNDVRPNLRRSLPYGFDPGCSPPSDNRPLRSADCHRRRGHLCRFGHRGGLLSSSSKN